MGAEAQNGELNQRSWKFWWHA